MKKIFWIIVSVSAVLAFCHPVRAAVTLMSHTGVGCTGGCSSAITTATSTVGASLLVACINSEGTAAAGTVGDSAGNTWTKIGSTNTGYLNEAMYYVANPTTASNDVFTASNSAGFYGTIQVEWFSGTASSPLDQTNSAVTGAATTLNPGTTTPTMAGEAVATCETQGGAGTQSITSPYTISDAFDFAGGLHDGGAMAYTIQTAAATTNPTWMGPSSNNKMVSTIATFLAAFVAPPTISTFSAAPPLVLSVGTSTLSWNVSGATSIAVTPGIFSTSTLVGSTTVNPTSTTLYLLTATGSGGTSTATTSVAIDGTPPSMPASLTATSTGSSTISLSWTSSTDVGGPGLAGYSIFRCAGGSCTPSVQLATSSGASFGDTALSTSTTYTYAVAAYDTLGLFSATSSNASATTMSIPTAPQSLATTFGNSQMSLAWLAPSSTGGSAISQYLVYDRFTGSSTFALVTTTTGSQTNATATSLTNGQGYDFEIIAQNIIGTSTPSNVATGTPLAVPGAPANLSAVSGSNSVTLSWSAPTSTGGSAITGYTVQYELTTGGTWSDFSGGPTASTSDIATGLSDGTSYDFRIVATNLTGQGPPSSPVTATPGEPAQVIIESFPNTDVPNIGTAVRITNEGSAAYEYQYTWCITVASSSACGGGDVFDATAAKLIQPGQNFDTTLTSTIYNPGNYWFQVDVNYGSGVSTASQSFVAIGIAVSPPSTTLTPAQSFGVAASRGGTFPSYVFMTGTSTPEVVAATSTPSSSLADQLAALQARLLVLLAGMNSTADAGSFSASSTFTRNLLFGSVGVDVRQLQQLLISRHSGPAAEKLAAHGSTEFFGTLTLQALIEFQEQAGIVPAEGFFGSITRAYVNSEL